MAKAIARRRSTDFGPVIRQKLEPSTYASRAMQYGRAKEDAARLAYVVHQQSTGHPGLRCSSVGFVVDAEEPWLGASPDGVAQDSVSTPERGLLEIKCPYVARKGISAVEYARV